MTDKRNLLDQRRAKQRNLLEQWAAKQDAEVALVGEEVVVEVLEEAANLLDTVGWTQGNNGIGEDGERCIVTAIRHVTDTLDSQGNLRRRPTAVARAAKTQVRQYLDLPSEHALMAWNDERDRTQGEVTDAIRHAAKKIRNREQNTP